MMTQNSGGKPPHSKGWRDFRGLALLPSSTRLQSCRIPNWHSAWRDTRLSLPVRRQTMLESIRESKAKLRRQVAQRVKSLTNEEREMAAAKARALLRAQPEWICARAVLFYAPLPGELDVWPLLVEALEAGKEVGLPRFDAGTGGYEACRIERLAQDLMAGRYGIREPAGHCRMLNQLDLILVPGVAFDLHGCRLGRGKGYYDQLLATVRGTTCGVAFEEQLVPEVPVEPHDVTLGCILTPSRWLQF